MYAHVSDLVLVCRLEPIVANDTPVRAHARALAGIKQSGLRNAFVTSWSGGMLFCTLQQDVMKAALSMYQASSP